MSLPKKKLDSQVRRCREVVESVLLTSMIEKRPADRLLRALFRQRKHLGARDRRAIRETVFNVYRWWGWLYVFAPAPFWRKLENGTTPEDIHRDDTTLTERRQWHRLMFAASYLERERVPGLAQMFAQTLDCDAKTMSSLWNAPQSAADRMTQLESVFLSAHKANPSKEPDHTSLIPSWAPHLIKSSVPLQDLIQWLQKRPPLWLRIRKAYWKHALEQLHADDVQITKSYPELGAIAVSPDSPDIYRTRPFREGYLQVQDLASQAVGHVCTGRPKERWWDACAGGGGKTLLLAEQLQGRGKVVASDVREYKLKDLRHRNRRTNFNNIETRAWDGKRVDKRRANFDGVLVDVPCSNSGTWRRRPDARWNVTREDIERTAALQLEILQNTSPAVKPGGLLVYATCSMFSMENEEVVHAFLEDNPEFHFDTFADPFEKEKNVNGCRQIWPWEMDTDAMFVARLRKESELTPRDFDLH